MRCNIYYKTPSVIPKMDIPPTLLKGRGLFSRREIGETFGDDDVESLKEEAELTELRILEMEAKIIQIQNELDGINSHIKELEAEYLKLPPESTTEPNLAQQIPRMDPTEPIRPSTAQNGDHSKINSMMEEQPLDIRAKKIVKRLKKLSEPVSNTVMKKYPALTADEEHHEKCQDIQSEMLSQLIDQLSYQNGAVSNDKPKEFFDATNVKTSTELKKLNRSIKKRMQQNQSKQTAYMNHQYQYDRTAEMMNGLSEKNEKFESMKLEKLVNMLLENNPFDQINQIDEQNDEKIIENIKLMLEKIASLNLGFSTAFH